MINGIQKIYNESSLDQLAGLLSESRHIVFLTGAGISTESGIPDFRSSSGLYHSGASENVFDITAFRKNPSDFYAFAVKFYTLIRDAKPNAAHCAIAELSHLQDKNVKVVTQNIDLLHQKAGAKKVYPVHGTVETSHCLKCGEVTDTEKLYPLIKGGIVPRHDGCGGVFKPDIVFFGELLPEDVFTGAQQAISAADLLVVAGTLLQVYPAAALPDCRRHECRLVIINQMETALDGEAHILFRAGVGKILPPAVKKIVANVD